jgi:peptidoglycan/xylan/chitin deacetylase (PgdA/CDA1 family)
VDRRAALRLIGTGGIAATAAHFATALPAAAADRGSREHADGAGRSHGVLRILWSVDTDEKAMALCFDDGPNPAYTQRILSLLRDREIVATFFVIGQMLAQHAALGRELIAGGHEVGNHTWSHRDAARLSGVEVRHEIELGAAAVREVLGVEPRWYRPPRGTLTGSALHAAHSMGEQVAMWSVTRGPGDVGATDHAGVRRHLVASFGPGAVIDLHDGLGRWNGAAGRGEGRSLARRRETELAVLPDVLDDALNRGYRFLTLTALAALDRASVDG